MTLLFDTVIPSTDQAAPQPVARLACVGVVVSLGSAALFPAVAAALRLAGVATVFRIDSACSRSLGYGSAARLMHWADALLSRLLPGSWVPSTPPESLSAAVVQLDALPTALSLVGASVDALVVVGEIPIDLAGRLRAEGLGLYRICLGSTADSATGRFGLSELLASEGIAMLHLERFGPSMAVQTLARMAVQTHAVSAAHTRAALLATLPCFVETTFRRLVTGRDLPAVCADKFKPIRAPTGGGPAACVRHVGRLVWAVVDRASRCSQWLLAVMPQAEPGTALDWDQLRPLLPPADRFWADPFLVTREGRNWLFFEEAPFESSKGKGVGHIAVAPIDARGFTGPVLRALDLPWHLSYPNVFEFKGEWYMIPECGSQKRIDLYRCTHWPDQWTHQSTLVDSYEGYDASIAKVGATYWLFAARRAEGVSTADLLDLFSAPSPLGPWRPHPASPVVMDVRSARPGGRPFVRDGCLIRPAQDSSGGVYGRALRFQRVSRIDEGGYCEETEHMVEPNRAGGILGIHSFAATNDLVVVDLCRKVFRPSLARRFQTRLPRPLVSTTRQLPDQSQGSGIT